METTEIEIKPNKKALKGTMKYIRKHPKEWDQNSYLNKSSESPCGTTACFAGTALITNGYRAEIRVREELDDFEELVFIDPDGLPVHDIEKEAKNLLGLTWDQSNEIFYAMDVTNPEELAAIVKSVTGVKV